VEDVEFSLQLLDKFNESNYVCKVLACLEVKRDDKQIATKIAIENPLGAEDCPESTMLLTEFIESVQKHTGNGKAQFKEILNALLDVRLRVPPIFNLDPQFILVDTKTGSVRLIVSKALFERKRNIQHLCKDDLRYLTPEELYGHGRSITSPFWVLGCMLYETQFNRNPFATVMQAKVTEEMIKKYPVHFPEEQEDIEDLIDLITNLLIKDPLQRLGSDGMESEVLSHAYFQS